MTRTKITDDVRAEWDEQSEWPSTFPTLLIDGKRLYMRLPSHHPLQNHIEVDVTPLYHYLKEMFTTNWEATDLHKSSNGSGEPPASKRASS